MHPYTSFVRGNPLVIIPYRYIVMAAIMGVVLMLGVVLVVEICPSTPGLTSCGVVE